MDNTTFGDSMSSAQAKGTCSAALHTFPAYGERVVVSGIHNYYSPQYLAHSGQPRIGVMYTQVLPGKRSVVVLPKVASAKLIPLLHYYSARRTGIIVLPDGLISVLAARALL